MMANIDGTIFHDVNLRGPIEFDIRAERLTIRLALGREALEVSLSIDETRELGRKLEEYQESTREAKAQ